MTIGAALNICCLFSPWQWLGMVLIREEGGWVFMLGLLAFILGLSACGRGPGHISR